MLKYPLLDTDALIEQSTSRTVAEIFEQEGEESFRELETSVLKVRMVKAEAYSEPRASPELTCSGGEYCRQDDLAQQWH